MTHRAAFLVAILLVAVAVFGYRMWPEHGPRVPAWEPVEGYIREIPDAVRLRHEHHLRQIRKGPLDLIFFGDSIARGWEDFDDLWEKHFASRRCGLFATSHDTTSNLLWRIDHGELEDVAPKVVVVLIGTNNRKDASQTADDIAKGIEAVINRIRVKQPQAKVLLLGILPLCRKPNDSDRVMYRHVNDILAKLSDEQTVFFRDHGSILLEADGQLTEAISPDGTHLTRLGYERWATVLEPDLKKLMGE